MTIIEASTVKCATLVDGTLRVTLDIEPRHAQAAFQLFGSPGRAVAIAGLKDGASALTSAPLPPPPEPPEKPAKRPPEPSKRSVEVAQAKAQRWHEKGPLERAAITLCKQADFQHWLGTDNEDNAVWKIYSWCGITTRAGLDANPEAAALFRSLLDSWRVANQAEQGHEEHA